MLKLKHKITKLIPELRVFVYCAALSALRFCVPRFRACNQLARKTHASRHNTTGGNFSKPLRGSRRSWRFVIQLGLRQIVPPNIGLGVSAESTLVENSSVKSRKSREIVSAASLNSYGRVTKRTKMATRNFRCVERENIYIYKRMTE